MSDASDARQKRLEALRARRARLSSETQDALDDRLGAASASDRAQTSQYRDAHVIMSAWTAGSAAPAYTWDELVAAARARAAIAPEGADLESYRRELEAANRAAIAAVACILRDTGAFSGAGAAADEIAEKLAVVPAYRSLIRRWLSTLAKEGVTCAADAAQFSPPSGFDETQRRVMSVLRGESHGLENFSIQTRGALPGSPFFEGAVQAFEEHIYSRYMNGIVVAVLEALRPKRLLEVGAGVGGTTAPMLAALRGTGAELVFTDVSTGFLKFASDRFRDDPTISYALFDLDEDSSFPKKSFDIVIGGNALHCARRLPDTMKRLRELLVDRGVLVLREGNANSPCHMISQGLLPGATAYEDLRLGDNLGPLVDPETWRALCFDAGFQRFAAFPEPGGSMEPLDERVMIAS